MITTKSNVIFSTVPNLVTSFLKTKGLKTHHAEFLGQSVNSAIMFAKGSGIAASTAVATHAFCKHVLGWKHEHATVLGNVAATVVSTSKKLTLLGLAHTAVITLGSYTTNKIGKIISKKISKILQSSTK